MQHRYTCSLLVVVSYCFWGVVLAQPQVTLPPPGTPTAERGQNCGPAHNAVCGDNQCCSSSFICGESRDHCVGSACMPGWGKCGPEFVREAQTEFTSDGIILSTTGGPCGPTHKAICRGQQCCGISNFCGVEPGHCSLDKGCQAGWGRCDGPNGTTSSPPKAPAPPTYDKQMAPDRVVTVVCSTLGGIAALASISFIIYRLHLHRQQLQANNSLIGIGSTGTRRSRLALMQWFRARQAASSASPGRSPASSDTGSSDSRAAGSTAGGKAAMHPTAMHPSGNTAGGSAAVYPAGSAGAEFNQQCTTGAIDPNSCVSIDRMRPPPESMPPPDHAAVDVWYTQQQGNRHVPVFPGPILQAQQPKPMAKVNQIAT